MAEARKPPTGYVNRRLRNPGGKLTDPKTLRPQQWLFAQEYLKDFDGTKAALRAGYGKGNRQQAYHSGHGLLNDVRIQAIVEQRKAELAAEIAVDQTWVVKRLKLFADIQRINIKRLYREDGSLKLPHEIDDDMAALLSNLTTVEQPVPAGSPPGTQPKMVTTGFTMGRSDAIKALDMLAKYTKMYMPDESTVSTQIKVIGGFTQKLIETTDADDPPLTEDEIAPVDPEDLCMHDQRAKGLRRPYGKLMGALPEETL
jgi:hypothetical protein